MNRARREARNAGFQPPTNGLPTLFQPPTNGVCVPTPYNPLTLEQGQRGLEPAGSVPRAMDIEAGRGVAVIDHRPPRVIGSERRLSDTQICF